MRSLPMCTDHSSVKPDLRSSAALERDGRQGLMDGPLGRFIGHRQRRQLNNRSTASPFGINPRPGPRGSVSSLRQTMHADMPVVRVREHINQSAGFLVDFQDAGGRYAHKEGVPRRLTETTHKDGPCNDRSEKEWVEDASRPSMLCQPATNNAWHMAEEEEPDAPVTHQPNTLHALPITVVDIDRSTFSVVNENRAISGNGDIVASANSRVVDDNLGRVEPDKAAESIEQDEGTILRHARGIQVDMARRDIADADELGPVVCLFVDLQRLERELT